MRQALSPCKGPIEVIFIFIQNALNTQLFRAAKKFYKTNSVSAGSVCFITQRRKELEATVLLAVLINGNLLELDHEFIDFLYANNPSLAKKSEPACSFTGRSSSFIFFSVTTV